MNDPVASSWRGSWPQYWRTPLEVAFADVEDQYGDLSFLGYTRRPIVGEWDEGHRDVGVAACYEHFADTLERREDNTRLRRLAEQAARGGARNEAYWHYRLERAELREAELAARNEAYWQERGELAPEEATDWWTDAGIVA